ncbi:sodium/potassium/calcium exchanger 2 isoform 2 [Corchorus olitorius]|uniref:Sodium/potassium/calcium exchanger 2 isoform 2 n=1 Tax=Corchorus olitorius TaxID=93759 RepID=A0A1R3JP82_9ROSI|nr:sodium/potassium/calcium exchanger 2 isoform 2 [Corchorus olitorius]
MASANEMSDIEIPDAVDIHVDVENEENGEDAVQNNRSSVDVVVAGDEGDNSHP